MLQSFPQQICLGDEHFWLGLYDAQSGLLKMFSWVFFSVSKKETKMHLRL